MNIAELRREIKFAKKHRRSRAAFGSIIRRHYDEISKMTPDEKRRFIAALGSPSTYYTELQKELNVVKYNAWRARQ